MTNKYEGIVFGLLPADEQERLRKALISGASIQFFDGEKWDNEGIYKEYGFVPWFAYRIAPGQEEPRNSLIARPNPAAAPAPKKFRPWTAKDKLPAPLMVMEKGNKCWRYAYPLWDGIRVANGAAYKWEEAFDKLEQHDGQPCGAEVKEESK